jgi:hypothetical protein
MGIAEMLVTAETFVSAVVSASRGRAAKHTETIVACHSICRVGHARRTLCLLRIVKSQPVCQRCIFHCIVKKETRNVNNVNNANNANDLNAGVRRSRSSLTA